MGFKTNPGDENREAELEANVPLELPSHLRRRTIVVETKGRRSIGSKPAAPSSSTTTTIEVVRKIKSGNSSADVTVKQGAPKIQLNPAVTPFSKRQDVP